MGFEHVIKARLKALGIRHMNAGGALGQIESDPVQGIATVAGGLVAGPAGAAAANGATAPGGYLSKVVGNPSKTLTPQNSYQQAVPTINTSDFAPDQTAGSNLFGLGQKDVTTSINDINNSAKNVTGEAGSVNASAGDLDSLAAGLGGQGGILHQQQNLANTLLAQSQGQGPNPAEEAFKQNLGNAVNQQAGAIASTKGLNPALAARMAADNSASTVQGAASNEAQLQAQQQLSAQQQLAAQQQAMGATVGEQGALYGAGGNLQTQAGGLYGQAGGLYNDAGGLGTGQTNSGISMFGTAAGANNAQNNTMTTGQLGAGKINAEVSNANTAATQKTQSGALNGLGGAISQTGVFSPTGAVGSAAQAGDYKGGVIGADHRASGGLMSFLPLALMALAKGGEAGAPLPTPISLVDHRAMALAHALMATGGSVPGTPNHPGDDPRNDVVPTVLSRGEEVLPNSVTQSPNAPELAKEFVEQLQAKSHPTFGKVLQARKKLKDAETVHRRCSGGYAS